MQKSADAKKEKASYSNGRRNSNGEQLVDLCEENKLFITNSTFSHPSRHQTTWVGQKRDKETGTLILFNQIAFILCRQRHKHFITSTRSYAGTILMSDHKLMKTNFVIEWYKQRCNKNTIHPSPKINIGNKQTTYDCRSQYQRLLDAELDQLMDDNNKSSSDLSWHYVQKALKQLAVQSAGPMLNKRPHLTYSHINIGYQKVA